MLFEALPPSGQTSALTLKWERALAMHLLFFFAFVSLALVVTLFLGEINPFRPKPLPMLEQIDLYMAENPNVDPNDDDGLALAA